MVSESTTFGYCCKQTPQRDPPFQPATNKGHYSQPQTSPSMRPLWVSSSLGLFLSIGPAPRHLLLLCQHLLRRRERLKGVGRTRASKELGDAGNVVRALQLEEGVLGSCQPPEGGPPDLPRSFMRLSPRSGPRPSMT